jgi:hypothetical protein
VTTEKPGQLATALAAFQAALPRVGKDNLAVVKSDKGSYKYTYADLSDVSHAVLPALAKHGLSFSAKPTLLDGKFVLEYTLRHSSGESDTGWYPLTATGTPQQVGSAITYARRYALSAVTGIVPDEDDDGQAAEQAPPAPQRAAQQEPEYDEPEPVVTVAQARGHLAASCKDNGWDLGRVAALYAEKNGHNIAEATNPELIGKFRESLFALPNSDLTADAGAAA